MLYSVPFLPAFTAKAVAQTFEILIVALKNQIHIGNQAYYIFGEKGKKGNQNQQKSENTSN